MMTLFTGVTARYLKYAIFTQLLLFLKDVCSWGESPAKKVMWSGNIMVLLDQMFWFGLEHNKYWVNSILYLMYH